LVVVQRDGDDDDEDERRKKILKMIYQNLKLAKLSSSSTFSLSIILFCNI
jgi:hypothetical protein